MAVKVRVEVMMDEKKMTSIENVGDSISEALDPLAIRNIINFLVNLRSSLSVDNLYDGESEDLTIKERLAHFLRYDERAPKDWFTSSQLKRTYKEVYEADVRLSTISTYLASMHSDGILERKGSRAMRQYRLASAEAVKPLGVVNAV